MDFYLKSSLLNEQPLPGECLENDALAQQPDGLPLDKPPAPAVTVSTPIGQRGEWPDLDLQREDHRLRTMRDWPAKNFINAKHAAGKGLYYFGVADTLCCFFCNVKLWQWKPEDDVEVKHARWSPDCVLVQLAGAKHQAYAKETARLESFHEWPLQMTTRQAPAVLAKAGFYYTGCGDQTNCYYCGISIQHWEDGDDPWNRHALASNRCQYLRVIKGDDYIQKVESDNSEPIAASASAPDPGTDFKGDLTDCCKICYNNDTVCCFVPCGHVVACLTCANALTTCPMCRLPIKYLLNLFYT